MTDSKQEPAIIIANNDPSLDCVGNVVLNTFEAENTCQQLHIIISSVPICSFKIEVFVSWLRFRFSSFDNLVDVRRSTDPHGVLLRKSC